MRLFLRPFLSRKPEIRARANFRTLTLLFELFTQAIKECLRNCSDPFSILREMQMTNDLPRHTKVQAHCDPVTQPILKHDKLGKRVELTSLSLNRHVLI